MQTLYEGYDGSGEKDKKMKKYGFEIAIVALGLSQMCSTALVAEWNFNEAGNLGYDAVGSNHLVTGSGFTTPTYNAAGRVGGAASFSNDTAFTTPPNIYPNGDFTFSA